MDLLALAKERLAAGEPVEAERLFEKAVAQAPLEARAGMAAAAGRLAQRASQPQLAVRWYRRAQELSPREPEHPHDRGIAHLETGEVGLAAQAQGEALALDPDHLGARAQRAAALEALGDDEGAAHELEQLLRRTGPQPALNVRLAALRDHAQAAARRRLAGAPFARAASSHVVGRTFAPRDATSWRSPFAALELRGGALALVFDDMDASLQRSDLSYGGATVDDEGRRVPLDEFTSAATIFLSEALGIDPTRARRVLRWLLTAEAGRGPHRVAGALVSWLVIEDEGRRRYGLRVEPAPEMV